MALQSSGAISINDIRTELGETTGSLRSLSATAGFSSPDAISEFYGYSAATGPSVTTNAATSVTVTSVTLNGNVTSDGGSTVTARGFYFGTNSNATSNPTYGSGSGTGAFSLNRTGLTGSTTYYFAAYATNASGTTVGSTLSFTTQAAVSLINRCSATATVYGYSDNAASYSFNIGYGYGYIRFRTYVQYNHPNYGWTNELYQDRSYGFGSDTSLANSKTYGNATWQNIGYNFKTTSSSSTYVQNRYYIRCDQWGHSYATNYNVTFPSGRKMRGQHQLSYCQYNNLNSGWSWSGTSQNQTYGYWVGGTYGSMDGSTDQYSSQWATINDTFSFNATITSVNQQYPWRLGQHIKTWNVY